MRPALLLASLLLAGGGCAQTGPAADPADARADEPLTAGPIMVGPMRAEAVYDAATLVGAMHARYAETWYRTLSFTQATSQKRPDGTVGVETWREWMAVPGRLRIEMGDPMAGPDVLFVGDSTYAYRDGQLAAVRADRNPLLLWGFDVYVQPPAETLAILEAEGLDLGAFREASWQDRPAYVLGTPAAGEVWVDRETLLFVRHVEQRAGGRLQDVRFEDYEPLGGGWVAPRVEVWADGDLVFWEDYSDIVADEDLDPVLFDPRRWAAGVAAHD